MTTKRRAGRQRRSGASTPAKSRKRQSRVAREGSKPLTRITVAELERMKQASRDADAADLASGRKSVEDLRRENEPFYGARVRIDYRNCKNPK